MTPDAVDAHFQKSKSFLLKRVRKDSKDRNSDLETEIESKVDV